ncbi:MAG: hypothetical protein Q8L79_07935 [Methylobacter sp.]|uniref:hypothetical protein n=1 Tax=Methylobacter sp. TaxID=2051955 RepID=UPI002730CFA9|nr:hypothetical protein [Methylobacter sp.]MDP1665044.1 hypothetical protein [Methylobacter sp.]
MKNVKGFTYFEVEFNKDGSIHDQNQAKALMDFLELGSVSDLFVISHGWNNDMADARGLYSRFFECMRAVINSGAVDGISTRSFAVLAVLWPSKKFAEQDLIPGGAASGNSPITNDFLKQELNGMKGSFDSKDADAVLDKAIRLVAKLEDSPKAQAEFADLLRSILPKPTPDNTDASADFFKLPGDEIIKRLSKPVPIVQLQPAAGLGGAAITTNGTGSAGGGAAGIGQFFSGIKSGALNLLNLTTYYLMKERAGLVGSKGLNSLLKAILVQPTKIKLHLIGHSFGGRVVTAATAGPDDRQHVIVDTLTLLQAAFSHYGFAERYDEKNDGYFRKVVTNKTVKGPTVISFTKNDLAVGKAYPLASLIAGQVAAELGDKNDKYGGLGRNGAQKTPEATEGKLLALNMPYQLVAGKLHNLNADAIIKSHSDICHNEVAYAILAAVSET